MSAEFLEFAAVMGIHEGGKNDNFRFSELLINFEDNETRFPYSNNNVEINQKTKDFMVKFSPRVLF